jgi:UDP-N-acetylglucosamine:LPS N-acetylglucosamine transferase
VTVVELPARQRRPRVVLVASAGGHLAQLVQLRAYWETYDRVWVSFDKLDVRSRLAGERVVHGHWPTTRSVVNAVRNLHLAWQVLRSERPDLVVTSGAGLGVPFVFAARVLGIRSAYLEVYDRIDSPTLSGRLCHRVVDLFLVQWEEQRRFYRRAVLAGPVY